MSQKERNSKSRKRLHLPFLRGIALLLPLFVAGLFLAGCNHDSLKGSGSSVSLGATLGGSSAQSKSGLPSELSSNTRYTGEVAGNVEKIVWVAGDKVTVTSAECYGSKSADYVLTPVSGQEQKAIVAPVSNDLWWNYSESTHHFYSLYPAKSSISDASAKSATSLSSDGSGSFGAYVLASQSSTYDATLSTATSRIYQPNMQGLYMWSGASVKLRDPVSLTFRSAITAFEFNIKGELAEELTVESISLTSISESNLPICALSGPFKGKIAQGGASVSFADVGTEKYIPNASTSNNTITTSLNDSDAKISTTKSVRATLFALPGSRVSGKSDKLTNLKLTVVLKAGSATLTRTLFLKDKTTKALLDFDGRKKYKFTLSVPTFKEVSFSVTEVVNPLDTASDVTAKDLEVVELDNGGDDFLIW